MVPADLESLLEKIHSFQNNPEKSYTKKNTEKKAKHTYSGYLWFTCCSLDASKNKLGQGNTVWKGFVKT